MRQSPRQNPPQPGGQVSRGLTAELLQRAMCLQHCLLHDVGRIDPRPDLVMELRAGQQPQIAAIAVEIALHRSEGRQA
jgi:hypothetical protein